jgi:hypothetical protein
LTGEDATELVRRAVRVSVKDGFKIIPVGQAKLLPLNGLFRLRNHASAAATTDACCPPTRRDRFTAHWREPHRLLAGHYRQEPGLAVAVVAVAGYSALEPPLSSPHGQ